MVDIIKNIPEEQPPKDPTLLSEWLSRMMILINGALTNTSIADITGTYPTTVTNGMTKYFSVAIPPEILYPGPYMYIEGEWLSLNQQSVVTMIGVHAPDQIPLALDTPLQIQFGPAQTSIDESIAIGADGTLTFLKNVTVAATLACHYTRINNNNDCYLVFSSAFNGNYGPNSIIRSIGRSNQPEGFEIAYQFSGVVGDEVKFSVTRDSTGSNDGYLRTFDATNPLFPSGHSASIRITRLV